MINLVRSIVVPALICNQRHHWRGCCSVMSGTSRCLRTIFGPLREVTYGGKRYFLRSVTSPNRPIVVEPQKNDSKVQGIHLEHIAWVERNTSYPVKNLHEGSAKKFLCMCTALKKKGIILTTLSPYILEFIRRPERMKHTILDKVLALLKKSVIERSYWGETVTHAAYLQIGVCNPALEEKTPNEVLLRQALNNTAIRKFGCAACVHVHEVTSSSKLENNVQLGRIWLLAMD